MDTIYGHFDDLQIEEYKEKLHKEMFWLLLYKDAKTKDEFKNVDFEKYFINLMKKIDGLNTLIFYPVEIVAIMSLLQAALNETRSDDFNYRSYRKLILDAHSLVDKINSRSLFYGYGRNVQKLFVIIWQ